MSLSDSQSSAPKAGAAVLCRVKNINASRDRALEGHCQAGLGCLITLICINFQSHLLEQCSGLPLDVPSPCPGFAFGVSPSEQYFVSLQLTGATF